MVRLFSVLVLLGSLVLALEGCTTFRQPSHKLAEEKRLDCMSSPDFNRCRMQADQRGSYPFARPGHR